MYWQVGGMIVTHSPHGMWAVCAACLRYGNQNRAKSVYITTLAAKMEFAIRADTIATVASSRKRKVQNGSDYMEEVMLRLVIINDGLGADENASYEYRVYVNYELIDEGRVEGHNRKDGWRALVGMIAEEAVDKRQGDVVE